MSDDTPIDEEESVSEESVVKDSPGELLKRQREKLDLAEKSVAEELHITVHYVRLLESNDFESLPGDVFARGYIKSYAGLLGLDTKLITDLYNEYTRHHRESEEVEAQKRRAKRYKDRNLPWIVFSGLAFIVVLIGLWYFGSGRGESDAGIGLTQTIDTDKEIADNTSVLKPDQGSANENSSLTQPSLPTQSPADTIAAVPRSIIVNDVAATQRKPELHIEIDPANLAVEAGSTNQQDPDVIITRADVPGSLSLASGVEIIETNIDSITIIEVTSGGDDSLEITFSGESWIEVDDKDGNRIYRDIRESGDILRIKGSAPFDVLLGDAIYAQLNLNGAQIDFAANIRIDNSARLTVGL